MIADRISGWTIDANTINVDNLNASNLKSGYIDSGRISDSGKHLGSLYVTNSYTRGNYSGIVLLVNSASPDTWDTNHTRLDKTGVRIVSNGTQQAYKSWSDILSGTTAVFG